MCGRLAQTIAPAKAAEIFDVTEALPNSRPSFNVPPTGDVMVVRRNPQTSRRHLDVLRWGLIPHWSKEVPSTALFNARIETVLEKRSFKNAWTAGRRCLVPADVFYEWQKEAKARRPFAVARADGRQLAFAGLWDNWCAPETGGWRRSCTILTREARGAIAEIHHRMPIALSEADWTDWLEATNLDPRALNTLPGPELTCWEVSARVNSVGNDDADLPLPRTGQPEPVAAVPEGRLL